MSDDFKQAIEQVKLRNPIEDVVRERVPGLRRAGSLWSACCPFHEERTPSFKVDPRRGTWRCYGACGVGGDQIAFVERAYNVEFREALEILAARVGITLPKKAGERAKEEHDELYAVLARAEEFYRRWLRRPEGAAALNYVRNRGLTDATIDAFGVGFAPIGGRELVARAIGQGVTQARLIELGLARADATGGGIAHDFFQGRLMIPVRDLRGRTVGFGARRLSDETVGNSSGRSPKYINTPQTPVFHKGRVIYALDRALEHVRASGHMILVEGYTDVMAAHQVGLRTVVAVLGTATTEDHAALVRKSGARRVSLLFDADDAGNRATWRALEGLLSLDVAIDVVRLVGDKDPCDLLVRDGVAPLEHALASATDWFQFLVGGVQSASGDGRWREIDRVLALLARIPRPVVRDERIAQLARALDLPVEGVRAQFQSLPERRREEQRAAQSAAAPIAAEPRNARPLDARSLRLREAFADVIGAALLEPTRVPALAELAPHCVAADQRRLIELLTALHARHGDGLTPEHVLVELADDPARTLVTDLLDSAALAYSAHELFESGANLVLEVSAECEERRRIDAWQHDRARQSDRDSESLDTQRTDQTDKLEELHRWMAARIKQH